MPKITTFRILSCGSSETDWWQRRNPSWEVRLSTMTPGPGTQTKNTNEIEILMNPRRFICRLVIFHIYI